MKNKIRSITFAGVIACLYTVLTLIPGISSFSYGPIQLRVAETLTILPLFNPWAIAGLTVGCAVSNLASPMMALDLPFGTLATLLAGIFTYLLRKKPILALAMPAIFNGIIVGAVITFASKNPVLLGMNMMTVAIGEVVVCYVLGYPLMRYIRKNKVFKMLYN